MLCDFIKNIEAEIDASTIKVHIRIRKLSAHRYITSIEGFEHYSIPTNKFIKTIKAKHGCSASFDKKTNIISFSGDQRNNIKKLLIKKHVPEDNITIHGF